MNLVREVEVLRVVAEFPMACSQSDLNAARDQILTWSRRKIGSLPNSAWDGKSFVHPLAGRSAMATRVETVSDDIWVIQINDPDKTMPGRTWTTEVSIGQRTGQAAKLGLRLSATTGEEQLEIDPAVPGLMQ